MAVERRIPPAPPFSKGGTETSAPSVPSIVKSGPEDSASPPGTTSAPPFEKGGSGCDVIEGKIPPRERKLALTDYASSLKANARSLRKRQTDAEQRLWLHLRRDQLGVRFLRQRPLGPYIVDFYAPKARLVIEVDGSQHLDDPAIKTQDEIRDAWLRSQGLQILRFDDRQVLAETQAVLEVTFRAVENAIGGEIPPSMTAPPNPPFAKGGVPLAPAEGSPPLQKGGQGGFSDASTRDEDSA